MLDDVMTIARIALLVSGAIAVAVWAARQPDQQSGLLKRLTGTRGKDAEERRCAQDK